MSWFDVEAYADSIFRIREPALSPLAGANIWLIVGERSALLIDSGVGLAPLAPVVRGLTPLPVTLLATHTHYDHVGGAHEFAERRVHAEEAAALRTPSPETGMWEGWLTESCFAHFPEPDFDLGRYRVHPAPATHLVGDADVIDLGGRKVEIVHAPGRSPGLVCAFERASGALFSSDALYDGEMYFDLPLSDAAAAAISIEHLWVRTPTAVYPGHFEIISAGSLAPVVERALAQARP